MKISSINTLTPTHSVVQRKRQAKNNAILQNQSENLAFNGLESAKKGAVIGGVLGAALFASAGAALPLIAMMAAEEAILGAAVGSMFKDDEIDDLLTDD